MSSKSGAHQFGNDDRIEVVKGTCEDLSGFTDNSFDVVILNGVIHHTKSDLRAMLNDHARALKQGGVMFVMLVGKGGLELKIWEFVRGFLNDTPCFGYKESFNGKLRDELLNGEIFTSLLEAQMLIKNWRNKYNNFDRIAH